MKVLVIGEPKGNASHLLEALIKSGVDVVYDNSTNIRGKSFDYIIVDELVNLKDEEVSQCTL